MPPPIVLIVGARPSASHTFPEKPVPLFSLYMLNNLIGLFSLFIFYQKLLLICTYPRCYCKWELLILPPIPNALYQRIRFHLVDMEGCQRFLWASSRLFQSDLSVCVSSSYTSTMLASLFFAKRVTEILHNPLRKNL